ncbi:MAG: hypothetical protein F4Y96_06225 [Chloroflexi bacterium]|nr:hypothetical protein [Chloroflexota bacterium]
MGRTERITIITLGTVVGVALLALMGLMWAVLNDMRQAVSSVDGVVKEIAKVQGVQEGVLNRLDTLPALSESDENASGEGGSADLGMIGPGRPSVSARGLWDDFDANQVRAYETYTEPRVWAVSGTVDSVEYGDSNYIYVGLDGLVRVGFRSDYERDWLDEIDKGQRLWFECEVRGPDEDGLIVCISPND